MLRVTSVDTVAGYNDDGDLRNLNDQLKQTGKDESQALHLCDATAVG